MLQILKNNQGRGRLAQRVAVTRYYYTSACPYVHGRTCMAVRAKKNQKKNQQLSNNHTGRSFTLVNDDWIGALCLSLNAHKKSRN